MAVKIGGMSDAELKSSTDDLYSKLYSSKQSNQLSKNERTVLFKQYDLMHTEQIRRYEKHEKAVRKEMADLKASATPDGSPQLHGMAVPEQMKELKVPGIGPVFQWAAGAEHAALRSIKTLKDNWHTIPEPLRDVQSHVVFSTQRNKDDPHWEKVYNTPGFKSAATGGDGRIVAYDGGGLDAGLFAHEAGHNLATKLWGSTVPPATSEYGQAQQKEMPVSDYGANSPSEDFAEACRKYADNRVIVLAWNP